MLNWLKTLIQKKSTTPKSAPTAMTDAAPSGTHLVVDRYPSYPGTLYGLRPKPAGVTAAAPLAPNAPAQSLPIPSANRKLKARRGL